MGPSHRPSTGTCQSPIQFDRPKGSVGQSVEDQLWCAVDCVVAAAGQAFN